MERRYKGLAKAVRTARPLPDEEQLQQLHSGEVLLTPEIVSRLFPELVSWVTLLEEEILQKGQPLLSENRRDAEVIITTGIALVGSYRSRANRRLM